MDKVLTIKNKSIPLTWSYLKTMQTKANESNSLVSISLPIIVSSSFNCLHLSR